MGDKTKISWTDSTWSCLRGCSRTIAPGATTSGCGDPTGGGCYAERNGYRFAGAGLPYDGLVRMTPNGPRWTGKVRLVDEHLLDPIRWQRPRRIFTTSVSDPFHERFSNETIAVLFGVMAATGRHIHQCLTKRVERAAFWFTWVAAAAAKDGMTPAAWCFTMMQQYVGGTAAFSDADRKRVNGRALVDAARAAPWPLPWVWLGCSTEHQIAADERVSELLTIPAALHWISAEPLLGPIDLFAFLRGAVRDKSLGILGAHGITGLGWVVAGAESGHGARPADVEWFRRLRDQCKKAGVPFFLKQASEQIAPLFADGSHEDRHPYSVGFGAGSKRKPGGMIELPYLDGVHHANFPEAA